MDWLCANITPIFKKGDRTQPANYRSVNLTSVCCKTLEHILHTNVMSHLDDHNILCPQRHGFRKGHSCETQLIGTIQDVAADLDNKKQTDMIIMDFAKVPHSRLRACFPPPPKKNKQKKKKKKKKQPTGVFTGYHSRPTELNVLHCSISQSLPNSAT